MELVTLIGVTSLSLQMESNNGAGPFQPPMEKRETPFDVPSLQMEDTI